MTSGATGGLTERERVGAPMTHRDTQLRRSIRTPAVAHARPDQRQVFHASPGPLTLLISRHAPACQPTAGQRLSSRVERDLQHNINILFIDVFLFLQLFLLRSEVLEQRGGLRYDLSQTTQCSHQRFSNPGKYEVNHLVLDEFGILLVQSSLRLSKANRQRACHTVYRESLRRFGKMLVPQ